jgi:FkbM family methyltransferase
MLFGLYDPVVESILRQYTPIGGTVIDAGAHLGYFSLRFARQVGPTGAVHAFECDPRLISRLRRHVKVNGLDWVIVNECGLLDHDTAEARLYLPSQLGWASMLEHAWGAEDHVAVKMVTLDGYVTEKGIDPEQLSFVKLDVEGCELQAIRGGRSVLASTSAPVLLEYIPSRMRATGQDPDELLSLMAELGFHPWSPVAMRRGQVKLAPGTEPRVGEDILFLK